MPYTLLGVISMKAEDLALKIAKARMVDIADTIAHMSDDELKVIYDTIYSAALDAIRSNNEDGHKRLYDYFVRGSSGKTGR